MHKLRNKFLLVAMPLVLALVACSPVGTVTPASQVIPNTALPTLPVPTDSVIPTVHSLPYIASPSIQFLDMLDVNNGWALTDSSVARTTDGGVSWYNVTPASLSGIQASSFFLDANTGWVTGSIPAAGEVYLYVTHDGGVIWSKQELPLPAGYEKYQYVPQAPVFFGKDGFLPLMIYLPDRVNLTFFVTHDGGLTWSGNPGEASKVIQAGLAAFADPQHAWSWDGSPELYFTTDGAETWQNASTTLNISGRLSQLQFITASAGQFTGWALTRTDEARHSQLYRTRDRMNWTSLLP